MTTLARQVDRDHEDEVARRLEAAWGMTLHHYALYDSLDYWAEKDGRMVAVVEVKAYNRAEGELPNAMMSLRKYLALLLTGVATGVHGLYVVRFTDSIRWIDVAMIDPMGRVKVGGRTDRNRPTDVEPIVLIPIRTMGHVR